MWLCVLCTVEITLAAAHHTLASMTEWAHMCCTGSAQA